MNLKICQSLMFSFILALTINTPSLSEAEPRTAGVLIKEYSSEAHGGGSISNDILEDSRGHIFLANESGLLKYNGETWTQMPATSHSSLVMSATIDSDNRIWIIGVGSLGYYQSNESGAYEYKDLTETIRSLPESTKFGTFWKIKYFKGEIFLITTTHVLRWKNEQWSTWEFQDKRRILPSWYDNDLYVHDRGKGLFRFNGNDFELIVPDSENIATGIIGIVGETEKGLLCVTVSNGLFWLKDQNLYSIQSEIELPLVTHATKLKDGKIVIGTANQGIVILNQSGALAHQISSNQQPIYTCIESSSGNLWVVGSGQIYKIQNRSLSFTDENAQDLLRKNDYIYYTNGSQIMAIHTHGEIEWTGAKVVDEAPSLWNIELSNKEIVYGTASSLKSITSDGTIRESPSSRAITSIHPSELDPDLIYTADVPKLSRWIKRNKNWEMLDTFENFNSAATSLVELTRTSLLISGVSGSLYIANSPKVGAGDRAPAALYKLGPAQGLPDTLIWAYCLRIDDTVIVVSNKGLYRYSLDAGTFRYDPVLGDDLGTDAYGLESCPLAGGNGWALRLESEDSQRKQQNLLGKLTFDQAGDLHWHPWDLPSLKHAGKVEALLHEVTDGKEVLWVGGSNSLLRYELSSMPDYEPLATNITAIRERSSQTIYYAGAGSVPELDGWSYPQQSLRIEYAAPPAPIEREGYQTRLLGFNDMWSEISLNTYSDFTNLREGKYTFEVRAIDEFGREGTTRSLSFIIRPPWYRTTYCYAGGCILFLLFIWTIMKLRSRHLIRRNLELEELINERTHRVEKQKLDLEKANRAKQNFLASMSHEIRNPLNAILGIVHMMHQKEAEDKKESEDVAHLYTSTNHLHQLLGQTLDYSSLESGKLRARSATFEACKLVDEIILMHCSMAESKGLTLNCIKPEKTCYWIGDPVLLRQVLINLASNAIKYTDEGSVELKLFYEDDEDSVHATFEVTDTGPGIPEDKRAYIFEEFTRLSRPDELNTPGTGLGLAIASEMSKLIGGKLSLDQNYTKGARFRLEIELEKDLYAQVSSKNEAEQSEVLKGQNALIADDMDFNRYVNAAVLKKMGATVHTAENGPKALDQLNGQDFEIAIMDVNMPGLTGPEVVQKYMEHAPENPPIFIALSAYNTTEMETRCLDAGFDYFLEKPLDPMKLIEIFGQHSSEQSEMTSNMMDYIADGDSELLTELQANYRQTLSDQMQALQHACDNENTPELREITHKLIGIACISQNTELSTLLTKLMESIKSSAPKEEIKQMVREASELAASCKPTISEQG